MSSSTTPAGMVDAEEVANSKIREVLERDTEMTSEPRSNQEALVLADLAVIGYPAPSLSDSAQSGLRYRDAIPILLHWLKVVDDRSVKEWIIRSMSVSWARPEPIEPLIEEFKRLPGDSTLGWVVGNALDALWDDDYYDSLASLAADRRYGTAREMIVHGLGRSKRPEAVDVLLDLINDPDVDGHATASLRRLRTPRARKAFEAKLADKRAWVRAEARKGLAYLDKKGT